MKRGGSKDSALDAIERAIRNGFAKGDAEDRAFRERVYRSAYAAMQKAIEANPNIDAEGAAKRRELFKRRVVEIEQEFVPAVETPGDVPDIDDTAPMVAAPPADLGDEEMLGDVRPGTVPAAPPAGARHRDVPPLSAERRETRRDPGNLDAAIAERDLADRRTRRRERRRPYALAFIIVTVLVAVGVGGWWGANVLLGGDGGAVPNPPRQLEEEEFQPEEQAGSRPASNGLPSSEGERDWIVIFDPADPTSVQASTGTSAEVVDRDGENMLRISSNRDGAAVSFDIGEGTLQRLAGRRAVFSVDASGEDGGETQISVECDFGSLGDCGRRRYIIGLERGDYLFELDLPQGTVSGSGRISINPDITNAGRQVDIYRVRVAPAS